MKVRVIVGLIGAIAACTPVRAPSAPEAPECAAGAGCDARVMASPSETPRAGAESQEPADSMPPDAKDAGMPDRTKEPRVDAGRQTSDAAAGAAAQGGSPGSSSEPAMRPQEQSTSEQDAGASDAALDDTEPAAAQSDLPVRPAESECDYLELRARNDVDNSPFQVPPGEVSQCFLIDAGFDAPTQALEFKALADNPDLLMHMVVRTLDSSDIRGPLISCSADVPSHKMVAAWSPGMDDWYYPADVGIDLGRGLFHLEIRYKNDTGATVSDASGMRVCTTKKLRPRVASMSWLGNHAFIVPSGAQDYAIRGRCTPEMQREPIRILRVAPSMHRLGKRAVMQIDRIDGSTQPLLDEPYAWRQTKIYDTPATLRAGDTILSSCYYDNPTGASVSIGIESNKELCHFWVLASPAYALVGGLSFEENNACLGTP